MDYRHIKVEAITPVVGAIVSEIDLGYLSSDDVFAEISHAFWQYHVLFFGAKSCRRNRKAAWEICSAK